MKNIRTRKIIGAAMLAAVAVFVPFIHTKLDVVLWHALPMNFLKGAVISLATMLLYKRLSPLLKGRH